VLDLLDNPARLAEFSRAALAAAQPYSVESMSRRWDVILETMFPAAGKAAARP
jgi:hypothetical protein